MNEPIKPRLTKMGACGEALDWVADRDLKTAWAECERGDWMLWLAGGLGIDRKLLVQAACDCAETALKFVPEGEDRPRIVIETARAWCRGEATLDEVLEAADAVYAAYAAGASNAARAAAYAAADAAYADYADYAAHKEHADLVRQRIPFEVIEGAWNEMMQETGDE